MATDREQPDDFDDADVALLMQRAASAPPLRDEFARAISERLSGHFAARFSTIGETPSLERPSLVEKLQANSGNGAAIGLNGAAGLPEMNGHAEPSSIPFPTAEAAPPVAARRWGRWTVAAAAAAAMFVALVAWGPAYGWTAAIRAWVVGIVQPAGEGISEGAAVSQGADGSVAVTVPVAGESVTQSTPVAAPQNGVNFAGSDKAVTNAEPPSDNPKTAEKVAPAETTRQAPPFVPFDEPLEIEELTRRVDEGLTALWASRGIRPVGAASDAEFMRRVYLDLTGRIPSVNEVHKFLNDASPSKREQLVDQLLAHHDHATHLAAVWRGILLPETIDLTRLGGAIKFEEWLAGQFAGNKPYDQIVRDLLLVEGRVAESGPLLFYAAARMLPEELAAKTSRAFLGMRMECAECHDHPFDEVSQKDFWRFAAFFARISRPKGKMELTSPVLAVRDNRQGDVMVPESKEVVAPRLPYMEADLANDADGPPLRQHLADWLTSTNNGQFARATVNRVWAQLFGRGLVDPVDDMRPANPALAPDVLETLSRDFAASRFDLRRLFRAIVLTDAYQRTSRSVDNDPSRTLHFAQMNVKSLTAEQLYDCITTATRRGAAPAATNAPNAIGVERFQDTSRQAFIEQFRAPVGQTTDYHAGIPQALTLMHGGLIHSSTDLASSGLLKSLGAPFFTDKHRVETVFLSTLSRHPTPAEFEVIDRQMSSVTTNQERQQVLGDLLWALLNSGEFTFNH